MKKINSVLLGVALVLSSSQAEAGKFKVSMSFECLSLDGIPISKGTEMAAKCCRTANPGPECRIGFVSIAPAAAEDSVKYLNTASRGIRGASSLIGLETNPSDPDQRTQASSSGGNSTSLTSSAPSVAGGALADPDSSFSAKGFGANGSGGGSGGGAGAGGAGGAPALGGGDSGSKQASSNQASPSAENFGGGSYLAGSGDSKGKGDSASLEVASSDAKELKYGDEGLAGQGAGGLGAEDEGNGMSGSKEDAADYLSRIDRAASIFKIVSKRYEKELARNRIRMPK